MKEKNGERSQVPSSELIHSCMKFKIPWSDEI